MKVAATVQPPKLWKYLLGALIASLVLIPPWTLFVTQVIQPDSFILTQEQLMGKKWIWPVAGWLVLLPLAIVALFFGARWMMASNKIQAKDRQAQAQQVVVASDQSRREYVLEVIGLGVTLDKYRQGKLWEALKNGNPHVTIRERDKEKYPWSEAERAGISGGRGGDTLENGAQYTPMYYGVPVFNAQSPSDDPKITDSPDAPIVGLAGGGCFLWHGLASVRGRSPALRRASRPHSGRRLRLLRQQSRCTVCRAELK